MHSFEGQNNTLQDKLIELIKSSIHNSRWALHAKKAWEQTGEIDAVLYDDVFLAS
jgi:hypothetical protein